MNNQDIEDMLGVLYTIESANLTEEQNKALQTMIDIMDEILIEGRWS